MNEKEFERKNKMRSFRVRFQIFNFGLCLQIDVHALLFLGEPLQSRQISIETLYSILAFFRSIRTICFQTKLGTLKSK